MTLGYDQKLYILAFDHRGSFQKKFFGIEGEPDAEQTAIIADAKHLIFEGMLQAVSSGADPSATGVLVDEQFGSTVPQEARERGLKLAMPAERSGQNTFDFEYGDDFGEHILKLRPGLHEGARPLQPRRRRRGERRAARQAQAPQRLAQAARPQVPLRAARPGRGRRSSRPSAATPTATTRSCAPS